MDGQFHRCAVARFFTGGKNGGQTSANQAKLLVSQGGRAGCIAISQNEEVLLAGQAKFLQRLLPLLAVCPLLFLALAWITRRLLRPLDEIQRALEEFYTRGSGGQMQLCGMPHTELYEGSVPSHCLCAAYAAGSPARAGHRRR